MATETLTQRAQAAPGGPSRRIDRWLGHPVAFLATAAVLMALFGWTFFANPDRVAPTKDPAFYTWRTEALLSEDPATVIGIEGPDNVFSAGYRVTAPVIGGALRNIASIDPLKTTIFLMVGLPVLTALLLASFAYRQRRDPLIFHAVAFGAGSLMLTPPFVGYLDNVLTLFFLAAALSFIPGTKDSWPARIGFGSFLLLSGLAHTTTLVIFGVVLGAMSAARLVYRRFDLRSVLRDDGPMLASAFVAAVATAAIWTIGIWGVSADLGEAALPPPYDKDFFMDRLVLWVEAMRPLLNGPLFLIGAVGLLMAGRRAAEDELARVSIVWLAPLAGIFGFLAGMTYPYYRFFNTTLAWILLVGVGIYLACRFLIDLAERGGVNRLAPIGIVALAFIIGTNFTTGFDLSGWNNASGGWLSAQERADLDVLRTHLEDLDQPDRPVVFVIDSDDTSDRVYGYTKLSGNTSRYGLPHGQIDRGHIYLGDVTRFLFEGAPTERDQETYDHLSEVTLEDSLEGIEDSGEGPIVVIASIFNETGANATLVAGGSQLVSSGDLFPGTDIWVLQEGELRDLDGASLAQGPIEDEDPGMTHALWVAFAILLLLTPGALALFWFLPDATPADAIPMSAALGVGLVALVGIGVLAVARSPFDDGLAWITVVLCFAIGAAARFAAWKRVRRTSAA